ncbi:MAG: FkbM family methyltransferase [Endomicrobium sp.]|jgi:FkbM family methyltransferase|nr:FkbM family methyltransferase [Endomicrobium sp.]
MFCLRENNKYGFLKLRFQCKRGTKKYKIVTSIIRYENILKSLTKQLFYKIFLNNFVNKQRLHHFKVCGVNLKIYDNYLSEPRHIAYELNHNVYIFDNINFKQGDVAIDIGANVGMVSLLLAKKYPFLKIYAFEPCKPTYESLKSNIKLNNIPDGTITAYNMAVTKDGRNICMSYDSCASGNSNMFNFLNNNILCEKINNVKSITLDEIFKRHNINECKLLKIDCEGAEYEILYNTKLENLKNINHLRGEFHEGITPPPHTHTQPS